MDPTHRSRWLSVLLCAACACGRGATAPDASPPRADGTGAMTDAPSPGLDATLPADAPAPPADSPTKPGVDSGGGDGAAPSAALQVRALGVQGFVLAYGGDAVMTAPLFTRQSAIEVGLNLPISPDVPAIDRGIAGVDPVSLRAVVTGHAHYDHLLDVLHVLNVAPAARLYANRSARHILAAVAPDRAPGCTGPAPVPAITRERVIAVDEPTASSVDYTNCPAQRPAGAPLEGSWLAVPNSHVRLMPVCTTHPAQVGPYHFGAGSIDDDQCSLPTAASGWLEGQTVAYVIDFLDDAGRPAARVYYQDAPATRPLGEVPARILAERRVDLAILCVGSNDAVDNQPTDIIANLRPRFVFSGHWEDFFRPLDQPLQPIPLLNVDQYVSRAVAALSTEPADATLLVNDAPVPGRHVLIQPGTRLAVPLP